MLNPTRGRGFSNANESGICEEKRNSCGFPWLLPEPGQGTQEMMYNPERRTAGSLEEKQAHLLAW